MTSRKTIATRTARAIQRSAEAYTNVASWHHVHATEVEQVRVERQEVAQLGRLPGEERAPPGSGQHGQRDQPEHELLRPDLAGEQEQRDHQEAELGQPRPLRSPQPDQEHRKAAQSKQDVRQRVEQTECLRPGSRTVRSHRPAGWRAGSVRRCTRTCPSRPRGWSSIARTRPSPRLRRRTRARSQAAHVTAAVVTVIAAARNRAVRRASTMSGPIRNSG